MDTQKQEGMNAEGYGDESLNTASTGGDQQSGGASHNNQSKGGLHNNALHAASMGRSATAQTSHHSDSGLANTGTNISYEGPTAPGSGGSMGTGYTSGQSGAAPSISTDSDYEQAAVGKHFDKAEGDDNITDGGNAGNQNNG